LAGFARIRLLGVLSVDADTTLIKPFGLCPNGLVAQHLIPVAVRLYPLK
jgi:hypothetical protein